MLILFSCNQKSDIDHVKLNLSCDYDFATDTTGIDYWYDNFLSPYAEEGAISLPALSDWNEAIRVEGHGGWGMFDYFCSIYVEEDRKRLQLAYQSKRYMEDTVSFVVKERFISDAAYNSIIEKLNKMEICEFPNNLSPSSIQIDGMEYTFTAKQDSVVKVIVWQENRADQTRQKENLITWSKILMRMSGYPLPKATALVQHLQEDSVRLQIGLTDYTIVDSIQVYLAGEKLDEYFDRRIATANWRSIVNDCRVFVFMDTIILEPEIEPVERNYRY